MFSSVLALYLIVIESPGNIVSDISLLSPGILMSKEVYSISQEENLA